MNKRMDPVTYLQAWFEETTAEIGELQRDRDETRAILAALFDAIDGHQIPLPEAVREWRKRLK